MIPLENSSHYLGKANKLLSSIVDVERESKFLEIKTDCYIYFHEKAASNFITKVMGGRGKS